MTANQTILPTVFAYGGQVNPGFIDYTARLTGKKRPKVCFLPTALGDHPDYIDYWYQCCKGIDLDPYVLKVWIDSHGQQQSFEEIILAMDAIIIGGGNTLNMLGIWKAQGIDKILHQAYQEGIVLAGGSAGSMCWFNAGTSDSRPKQLSIVEGLGFLPYSHCPHYSGDPSRRPTYHQNIAEEQLSDGFACDDLSGIVFVEGKFKRAMALETGHHSYYVYKKEGLIVEERLESVIFI